jgi:hypothetical protein
MSERTGADVGPPMPLGAGLRRWFLQPPRPHGEVIEDRTVSFLELFYDLVYVVLVGQIAQTLAENVFVVRRTRFRRRLWTHLDRLV